MKPDKLPDFEKAAAALHKALDRSIPIKIGNRAENFFKQSFRNQGFTNNMLIPWKRTAKRKNVFGQKSQGILIKSGALKNSIRILHASGGLVHIAAGNQNVQYAKAHNEGFEGTVQVKEHKRTSTFKRKVKGGYTALGKKQRAKILTIMGGEHQVKSHQRKVKIPRRQFIGNSRALDKEIQQVVAKDLQQIEALIFKK